METLQDVEFLRYKNTCQHQHQHQYRKIGDDGGCCGSLGVAFASILTSIYSMYSSSSRATDCYLCSSVNAVTARTKTKRESRPRARVVN